MLYTLDTSNTSHNYNVTFKNTRGCDVYNTTYEVTYEELMNIDVELVATITSKSDSKHIILYTVDRECNSNELLPNYGSILNQNDTDIVRKFNA